MRQTAGDCVVPEGTGHLSSVSNQADKTTSSTTSTVTKGQLDALHDFTTNLPGGNGATSSPVAVSLSIGIDNVASGNSIGTGNDSAPLSATRSRQASRASSVT